MPINKAFRQLWVAAGYDERMGSAWVCPPPPSDVLRVYHFTSADHAASDIEKGRLKVARFSELNDPFELLGANFKERQIRNVIRSFKVKYSANTGLLCFSQNWTSPVLWSHYSDKHKGICLGFNVPKVCIQYVEYSDARLSPFENDADPSKLSKQLLKRLPYTKSAHWLYESEVRFFVELKEMLKDGEYYFHPFGPGLDLAEVILGENCNANLETIRALVKSRYPNTVTFAARMAFKSFAIVPDERKIP